MRRLISAAMLLAVVWCLPLGSANAQEPRDNAIWRGTWQGRQLTVVVIARGHTIPQNVRQSEPWWKWGNTTSDAYMFFWSADRLVDLVLDFSTVDARPMAKMYIPITNEHRLAIQLKDNDFTLPPSMLPTLTVWTRSGGWMVDGALNYELEIREIDQTSGAPKWQRSVGGDGRGLPMWTTSTLLTDVDATQGYPRFGATVRADNSVPYELATPLMPSWPYLSTGTKEGHYDKTQPIWFDSEKRVVTQTWVGFHTAGMYQFNSLAYPPKTNFEAPFAFYRFDQQAGRNPNMVIRSDVWPAGDRFGPSPSFLPRTAVRMTWTGQASGLWRYSLTVTGDHAMRDEVAIGPTRVIAVPYDRYPSWLTSQAWKAATYVEATGGEPGSEGIYDYSMEDNWAVVDWTNGFSETPPDHYDAPFLNLPKIDPKRLKQGFRGEYSLLYNQVPRLYASTIDRRTHLMYAEGGVWNLGNGRVLRTHNLDGGAYIDAWTRERLPSLPGTQWQERRAFAGDVEEALYHVSNTLVYSGRDSAELLLPDTQPTQPELTPPTDSASWRRYVEQAADYAGQGRDPHDLAAWMNEFSGKRLAFAGAAIQDLRALPDGMRFVLTLRPGFRVLDRSLWEFPDLAPGRYVVTYNGQYSIAALTRPAPTVALTVAELIELEQSAVNVQLNNTGLEDLKQAELQLWATSPAGEATTAVTSTVELLAQTPITTTLTWVPPSPGAWTLALKIRANNSTVTGFDPIQVMVGPSPNDSLAAAVAASAPTGWLPTSVLGLVALAASAFVIVHKFGPVQPARSHHDAP